MLHIALLLLSITLFVVVVLLWHLNQQHLRDLAELNEAHSQLQQLVYQRTAQVAWQQTQIAHYIHLNSHIVRGPLMRVLGIVIILKNNWCVDETENLLTKLEYSVQEVDEVLTTINSQLAQELV